MRDLVQKLSRQGRLQRNANLRAGLGGRRRGLPDHRGGRDRGGAVGRSRGARPERGRRLRHRGHRLFQVRLRLRLRLRVIWHR